MMKNKKNTRYTVKPLAACAALLGTLPTAMAADSFSIPLYLKQSTTVTSASAAAKPLVGVLISNTGIIRYEYGQDTSNEGFLGWWQIPYDCTNLDSTPRDVVDRFLNPNKCINLVSGKKEISGWKKWDQFVENVNDNDSDPYRMYRHMEKWPRNVWLQQALRQIILPPINPNGPLNPNDPDARNFRGYYDDFDWVYASTYGLGGMEYFYQGDNESKPAKSDLASVKAAFNKLTTTWQDGHAQTFTRNYVKLAQKLQSKMKRCQKAFIVVMSEGAVNGSCTDNPEEEAKSWDRGIDPNWKTSDTENINRYAQLFNRDQIKSTSGKCMIDTYSLPYDNYWDNKEGLAYFSHVYGKQNIRPDLKTQPQDCAEHDGIINPDCQYSSNNKPYDDHRISTMTFVFSNSPATREKRNIDYFQNGACKPVLQSDGTYKCDSSYYFRPSSPTEAMKMFTQIFDTIKRESTVGGAAAVSTYGANAPTVISGNVPNMAASVYLDTRKWASQLRFFGLDYNTKDNTVTLSKNWASPYFGNRKTLVSTFATPNWRDGVYWADNIPVGTLNNVQFGIGVESKTEAEDACGSKENQKCMPDNQVRSSIAASNGMVLANTENGKVMNLPLSPKKSGKYAVTVYFTSAPDRNLTLSINGTERFSQNVSTGSWMSMGSVTVNADLDSSKTNTLTIKAKAGISPDIDYYTLTYLGSGTTNPNEWKDAVIPWTIRAKNGNDINNAVQNPKYSQLYRQRPDDFNDLGDIIDSPVISIGRTMDSKNQYPEFLITAANDGMTHIFKYSGNNTGYAPYSLVLSYLPVAMENRDGSTLASKLTQVANAKYGSTINPHQYLMNGGIVARRVMSPSTIGGTKAAQQERDLFIVANMGQGGRGSYALNLKPLQESTNADSLKQTVPLFETPKHSANTPEYTIGAPQVGIISIAARSQDKKLPTSYTQNLRYSAVISSGLPPYKKDPAGTFGTGIADSALYVYDILGKEAYSGAAVSTNYGTGKPDRLIKKISTGSSSGLAQPTLVDVDFDGVVDIAYAGDYAGNMYRFDLRGEPKDWKAVKIFSGNGLQPITSAPAVSYNRNKNDDAPYNYVVIFGTGSDIYDTDRDDTQQQAVYGIFDDLDNANPAPVAYNDPLLLKQTVTGEDEVIDRSASSTATTSASTAANGVNSTANNNKTVILRKISHNTVSPNHKGWVLDLYNAKYPGERVTVKPSMVLSTALITSHSYQVVEGTEEKLYEPTDREDICVPMKKTTKTEAHSIIMGIDARTGGAVQADKDGNLESGAVSVEGWYNENGGYYYAGLVRTGMREIVYVDIDALMQATNGQQTDGAGPIVSVRTRDGDSGGSGTDNLNDLGVIKIPKNCFKSGKSGVVLGSGSGGVSGLSLVGGQCSGPKGTRLSWREIF